jgi:hypothetical protein
VRCSLPQARVARRLAREPARTPARCGVGTVPAYPRLLSKEVTMKAFVLWVGILAATALPLAAQADEVFEADLSLSAVVQGDDQGTPVIEKVKVTTEGLLNVARGRSPDAIVPANELLAVVVDCATKDASLVVFDTNGPSVLVTVADVDEVEELDVAFDAKGGSIVADLELEDVGDADNSVDGGHLLAAGRFKIGAGECPISVQAALSGVVDVTITDDVGTESFTLLALKGKLKTGKESIATLP